MSQTEKPEERYSTVPNHKESLSKQYGGIHSGRWITLLPSSWHPYIQLARLSPPSALFLIYFPHLFGILHAANSYKLPKFEVARACVLLFGGSFFCSNAAHAWNDLIDAPIDKQVARTMNRPIVRGAISPQAAFIFTVTQAIGAAAFLLLFPMTTVVATLPTITGTTYYPWAKRHTYFPQVVLGFCLAWGIVVAAAATGVNQPWADASTLCLVAASILWAVIYDTIYAYQDITDDIATGVKSTAVLFRNNTKHLLWFILFLMGALLVLYGSLAELGIAYNFITLGVAWDHWEL
ncbi:4-hydroxybenzoate polyprenyltransferase, mitochondrial [Cytospora mali]|uniref:Diterpenoid pyrone biosynthesis cluster protein C n=1 Tax=Cytospora mali TaxID=578113 RepID=A0A194V2Z8_CYTMA|nr:4-hydroxybenzoate polyprenyltransferase, mitochondrial [Valsa mali var. pyri (nom. inval.)]